MTATQTSNLIRSLLTTFSSLAEREGFEPPSPISQGSGFQDRRNRPLCHLSGAWQGGRDSNPQPTVLETATLPIELPPYSRRAHFTFYPITMEAGEISRDPASSSARL